MFALYPNRNAPVGQTQHKVQPYVSAAEQRSAFIIFFPQKFRFEPLNQPSFQLQRPADERSPEAELFENLQAKKKKGIGEKKNTQEVWWLLSARRQPRCSCREVLQH